MALSEQSVLKWCERLLARSPALPPLEECLRAIPTLESLADLPPGTRVLVRCDTNVVFDACGHLADEARLTSLLATLQFGRSRGWVQIILGHIGVDGSQSLRRVADFLGNLLECEIPLLSDWMDNDSGQVHASTGRDLARLPAGGMAMLENARQYSLEVCLWKPRPKTLLPLVSRLTNYARTAREQLAAVQVHEGFAASNCDLSSALVPLAMDRVALGRHVFQELSGPVLAAREAEAVVFSGAKFNKLDDLEAIVRRGRVRLVLAGGLLALPLLRAEAELAGREFELGRPDEVPSERIEQARRLMLAMREGQVELALPVDFVLEDGSLADAIPVGRAQRDAGPRTLDLFSNRLTAFAAKRRGAALFHNGVLGQFERPEFAAGTRRLFEILHGLHASGAAVYIGGGEGGLALAQLGDPTRVTHCFTAGTTILKALGDEGIPYVRALYLRGTKEFSTL